MKQTSPPQPSSKEEPQAPRLVGERVAAAAIGLSVAFLQKDRVTAQRIPVVRIGDRCLYDLNEVFAALKHYQQGGPQGRRTRGR